MSFLFILYLFLDFEKQIFTTVTVLQCTLPRFRFNLFFTIIGSFFSQNFLFRTPCTKYQGEHYV